MYLIASMISFTESPTFLDIFIAIKSSCIAIQYPNAVLLSVMIDTLRTLLSWRYNASVFCVDYISFFVFYISFLYFISLLITRISMYIIFAILGSIPVQGIPYMILLKTFHGFDLFNHYFSYSCIFSMRVIK
jgi:hypothetical protein